VIGIRANTPRCDIAFMSGRSENCREGTKRWLESRLMPPLSQLYMRAAGDSRPDTVVKKELYEKYIAPFYNVRAIFDDRPAVIRMWQDLGFADRIFNVGDGREF